MDVYKNILFITTKLIKIHLEFSLISIEITPRDISKQVLQGVKSKRILLLEDH